MKIKELFESNKSFDTFIFFGITLRSINEKLHIENDIINTINSSFFEVDSISISWENPNSSLGLIVKIKYNDTKPIIEKLILQQENKWLKKLKELHPNITISHGQKKEINVDCYSLLPTYNIEYHKIILNIKNKITLSNIHKCIDTDYLILDNQQNIIGNILGLLKIKNLNSIERNILTANNSLSEPLKIVQKYLKADKDILACQDELIENGFKEFAKL